jgi:hypothetical protein
MLKRRTKSLACGPTPEEVPKFGMEEVEMGMSLQRGGDTIRGGACGGWWCTRGSPPHPYGSRKGASSPTSPTAAAFAFHLRCARRRLLPQETNPNDTGEALGGFYSTASQGLAGFFAQTRKRAIYYEWGSYKQVHFIACHRFGLLRTNTLAGHLLWMRLI